jgi:hypothetical protein
LFRAIQDKSLVLKGSQCVGGKTAKGRITILFCVNAAGGKEQPFIINKSLRPRCFAKKNLETMGVDWYANKKTWMTCTIFQDWRRKFNQRMKNDDRNVLLMLDNAPCHLKECQLTNVKVVFLPTYSSSKFQPLDEGIIQSFKLFYRRRISSAFVARMDEENNLFDAVDWVKLAWDSVRESMIKRVLLRARRSPSYRRYLTILEPKNKK